MSLFEKCSHLLRAVKQICSQTAVWFAQVKGFIAHLLYLTDRSGTTLTSGTYSTDQKSTTNQLSNTQHTSTMASHATSMSDLPAELFLNMSEFLTRECILALKLSNSGFNRLLRMPLKDAEAELRDRPDCERLLILSLLSRDPSRRRCNLCKKIYDRKFFTSKNAPDEVPAHVLVNDVRYPPGLCHRETGRLMKVFNTGPGGRKGWATRKDAWCMCCGDIEGWHGKCDCRCSICPKWPVRTYTQYVDKKR